jgi:hypothetical protein
MTGPNRLDLAKGNEILRRANRDTVTGDKKTNAYRRAKRANAKYYKQRDREKQNQFGKFGAASPVRIIPTDGC